MKHPEEYKSSYTRKILNVPDIVLKEYPITNVINVWYRYFCSLGIKLEKNILVEDEEFLFPYMIWVKYNGDGFYEVRFQLERIKTEENIKPQIIPSHIQYDIENTLNLDDTCFIDCNPYVGDIYMSFNYDNIHRKYVRNQMLDKLKKKIEEKLQKTL